MLLDEGFDESVVYEWSSPAHLLFVNRAVHVKVNMSFYASFAEGMSTEDNGGLEHHFETYWTAKLFGILTLTYFLLFKNGRKVFS